jgi:hypothetical protein
MSGASKRSPPLLTRVTALFAILLVLTLAVLAASPDLHERLHGHMKGSSSHAAAPAQEDDDGGCVVTLFAQGVILALSFFSLVFTGQTLRRAHFAVFDRIAPSSPAYLFLPTQAPPAALT